jgi:hypothetical protein
VTSSGRFEMTTRLAVLAFLAVLVSICVSQTSASGAAAGCSRGQAKTVAGVEVVLFCGSAKATLHLAGGDYGGSRDVAFSGGACALHDGDLYVFIGPVPQAALRSNGLSGPAGTALRYFVLQTAYSTGSHRFGNVVYFGHDRQPWRLTALSTHVTVKAGLRSGSFSGSLLASEADSLTGSFTCGHGSD